MFTIEIQNLDETIAALNLVDKDMGKRLVKKIREICKPTLGRARGYAHVGGNPTGAFARSLSLKSHKTGVKFVSTDPGGGVIEFANPGALILQGPRAGRRAGVPHTGDTPRALLKAILEDEESIVQQVNAEVVDACDFQIGN